jgi:threonylcarbamoyladenosine tRNA methylthiotransferase MtaB
MKVSFKTLGCRLNQHETDALVSTFDREGFEIVDFKESSDITVINTCTVTSQSDHKSRNIIQQAIKANPGTQIVVTGCMAEQYKKELEQLPGVALVVSNTNKSNIVDLVKMKLNNEELLITQADVFSYQPVQKSLHTRAAIKIQDGCDNYCTFCIIPQVRGRAVSRPVSEILTNIKQTLANGFKELVITGVNIGRYYHEGVRFVELLKQILDIPGNFRIRISSLEPDGFGTELADLFENPKLAPHLHLCLQSGSDPILLKMRRMYSVDQYLDLIDTFKNRYPDFNLTTDIIVGFPGETETHFNQTLKLAGHVGFSHIHTFKYSVRSGTTAERMENQINETTKNSRSEAIREISDNNKREFYTKFMQKTEWVLVEKHLGDDWYFGYGEHYIPITFKHSHNLKNEFVQIRITDFADTEKLMMQGVFIQKQIIESKKKSILLNV